VKVQKLSTFGHHPDFTTDLEVEAEIIEGLVYEALVGMQTYEDVRKRVSRTVGIINMSSSVYFASRQAKQRIRNARDMLEGAWASA
jgi:hypothetical protein